ncbi:MAG: hypothetical protein N5P05_003966 [Chroococcopsis gigantea SAG 12.99]|jgi:hypothetical protein|nr:hypothetical protein [Chlorogloea purpurea SAG 13.99]MDV3002360.1 hypothetical protein [Chroococcopsis gigantea SAG 12.99]
MTVNVAIVAQGLQFLNFQGVTTLGNILIAATLEGKLIQITPDGVVIPWVDLTRYGIPTGIVGHDNIVIVLLSAQETGHFLMGVTTGGQISTIADLSDLIGEFGAPFGVSVHQGYYPYYWVALSTDVVSSLGLVARITPSGKVSVLSSLPSSPFGIASNADTLLVTQEDGNILRIAPDGQIISVANLVRLNYGIPLDITYHQSRWIITTNGGWLIALDTDGNVSPLINLQTAGYGIPSTLTSFNHSLFVALTNGFLVSVTNQSAKI